MAQVLVRNLETAVVEGLKERARAHKRSLQAELTVILEQAAKPNRAEFSALAAKLRKRLSGRPHTDSTQLLAEDRAR